MKRDCPSGKENLNAVSTGSLKNLPGIDKVYG